MELSVASSRASASGRRTLTLAATCLLDLAERLGDDFEAAVAAIHQCRGSVVTVGIGKCRIVAEKFAGTLNSVEAFATPLCGLEARHGYFGCIRPGDVLVAFSNSGESPEILELADVARERGAPVIGITRSRRSGLGQAADVVLDIGDHPEAGDLAVLPTTSSTAMMALGDALAMAVADGRGYRLEDLRRTHPGGPIGRL